ncbi:MAG TPA: protein kinase [Acidobacteriaceae bacterium]|jgi:serine/threonine protein kinase
MNHEEDSAIDGEASVAQSSRWASLRDLLGDVLALPVEQRLDALRTKITDPELLAEAEQLLGFEKQAGAMFSVTGWRKDAEAAVQTQLAGGMAEGSQIGPYRILRELGRGGMGAVYLAERGDGAYEQRVAVKLLQESISSPEMQKRFRAERQILAGLVHPGIARLLDGGVTPAGTPYLVLEYIEGMPIDRYCDEHEFGVKERLELFLKVADVVQVAHQQLVLHLDLKPANILIASDGEPRLLDFGIARFIGEDGVAQPSLLLMTPRYASPEQAAGQPLGVASDVFSLATLLYRLLTGALPNAIENLPPLEAARIIREVEPQTPSRRAASPAVAAELRGDLDLILLKALRKEPARRYATVSAFADDLRRYLSARPVLAHKGSFQYRAGKFVRRNWIMASAAAVVFTVIGLSVASVVRSSVIARRERASALNSAAIAEKEKSRAETAAIEAEQQRSSAQQSAVVAARERNSAERSTALALHERAAAENSATAAERDRASAEKDRASAERRLTDIQDLARFYVLDLFPSVTDVPNTLAVQKKMTENALKYLQSMSEDRGKDPKFSNDLAAGLYSMAMVQGFPNKPSLGDREGALRLFSMAIEMQKRHQMEAPSDPDSHAHMALMLSMKSSVTNSLGDVPGAIELEQQAWDEAQPILRGPKSSRWKQIATYCFFRAVYLSLDSQFHMADPEGALLWINRSEALLEEYAAAKPEVLKTSEFTTALANTRMSKAWYLHQLRRDDEARTLYEQQLTVVDAEKDSKSIELQHHRRDVHAAYADFLIDHGEIDHAVAVASILMPYRDVDATTGDDTWDKTDMSSELCRAALLDMHKGRTEEALRIMHESLGMSRSLHEHVPMDQTLSAQHVMNLVTLAQAPHMPAQEARSMFQESIPIASAYSKAHPTVLSSQIWEARAHIGLAKLARDEHHAEEQRRESAKALELLEAVIAQRPRHADTQELLATVRGIRD